MKAIMCSQCGAPLNGNECAYCGAKYSKEANNCVTVSMTIPEYSISCRDGKAWERKSMIDRMLYAE